MFEKFLQDIGLNEKKAKVYLQLLQMDSASVIDLASKTKINRTTVYTVLKSLSKKGLVSETTVGKKTHYQAEPPERLETFIERHNPPRKILIENPVLNKRFWGKHFWSRGYFTTTSGAITDEMIMDYIEHQDDDAEKRGDDFTILDID